MWMIYCYTTQNLNVVSVCTSITLKMCLYGVLIRIEKLKEINRCETYPNISFDKSYLTWTLSDEPLRALNDRTVLILTMLQQNRYVFMKDTRTYISHWLLVMMFDWNIAGNFFSAGDNFFEQVLGIGAMLNEPIRYTDQQFYKYFELICLEAMIRIWM